MMPVEEIDKSDMWAREWFIPKSRGPFHWGKFQITQNDPWEPYFEIYFPGFFVGVAGKELRVRYGLTNRK